MDQQRDRSVDQQSRKSETPRATPQSKTKGQSEEEQPANQDEAQLQQQALRKQYFVADWPGLQDSEYIEISNSAYGAMYRQKLIGVGLEPDEKNHVSFALRRAISLFESARDALDYVESLNQEYDIVCFANAKKRDEVRTFFTQMHCVSRIFIYSDRKVKGNKMRRITIRSPLSIKHVSNNKKNKAFLPLTFSTKSSIAHHFINVCWMLKSSKDEKAKKDFLKFVSESADYEINGKFSNEDYSLNGLSTLFSRDMSTQGQELLKMYTAESYFYKIINKGLRSLEHPAQVSPFRYPASVLSGEIRRLFCEQLKEQGRIAGTKCYRGVFLSESEIEYLKGNIGGFIMLAGFVSTSLNEKVVVGNFGNHFFQIEIPELTMKNCGIVSGFTQISHLSKSMHEEELLFNMLNIFKIISVTHENHIIPSDSPADDVQFSCYRVRLRLFVTYESIPSNPQILFSKQNVLSCEQGELKKFIKRLKMLKGKITSQLDALFVGGFESTALKHLQNKMSINTFPFVELGRVISCIDKNVIQSQQMLSKKKKSQLDEKINKMLDQIQQDLNDIKSTYKSSYNESYITPTYLERIRARVSSITAKAIKIVGCKSSRRQKYHHQSILQQSSRLFDDYSVLLQKQSQLYKSHIRIRAYLFGDFLSEANLEAYHNRKPLLLPDFSSNEETLSKQLYLKGELKNETFIWLWQQIIYRLPSGNTDGTRLWIRNYNKIILEHRAVLEEQKQMGWLVMQMHLYQAYTANDEQEKLVDYNRWKRMFENWEINDRGDLRLRVVLLGQICFIHKKMNKLMALIELSLRDLDKLKKWSEATEWVHIDEYFHFGLKLFSFFIKQSDASCNNFSIQLFVLLLELRQKILDMEKWTQCELTLSLTLKETTQKGNSISRAFLIARFYQIKTKFAALFPKLIQDQPNLEKIIKIRSCLIASKDHSSQLYFWLTDLIAFAQPGPQHSEPIAPQDKGALQKKRSERIAVQDKHSQPIAPSDKGALQNKRSQPIDFDSLLLSNISAIKSNSFQIFDQIRQYLSHMENAPLEYWHLDHVDHLLGRVQARLFMLEGSQIFDQICGILDKIKDKAQEKGLKFKSESVCQRLLLIYMFNRGWIRSTLLTCNHIVRNHKKSINGAYCFIEGLLSSKRQTIYQYLSHCLDDIFYGPMGVAADTELIAGLKSLKNYWRDQRFMQITQVIIQLASLIKRIIPPIQQQKQERELTYRNYLEVTTKNQKVQTFFDIFNIAVHQMQPRCIHQAMQKFWSLCKFLLSQMDAQESHQVQLIFKVQQLEYYQPALSHSELIGKIESVYQLWWASKDKNIYSNKLDLLLVRQMCSELIEQERALKSRNSRIGNMFKIEELGTRIEKFIEQRVRKKSRPFSFQPLLTIYFKLLNYSNSKQAKELLGNIINVIEFYVQPGTIKQALQCVFITNALAYQESLANQPHKIKIKIQIMRRRLELLILDEMALLQEFKTSIGRILTFLAE